MKGVLTLMEDLGAGDDAEILTLEQIASYSRHLHANNNCITVQYVNANKNSWNCEVGARSRQCGALWLLNSLFFCQARSNHLAAFRQEHAQVNFETETVDNRVAGSIVSDLGQ